MDEFIPCTLLDLPDEELLTAAHTAIECNPCNRPAGVMEPSHLAVLTTKYWGAGGVKLGVSFLDNPPADLKARILAHMNAWGEFCNVVFMESRQGEVRITRGGSGYWSYLGTDILHIPANRPTMNLQGFTMSTPESEFVRVIQHEAGHTCGFPHEHMRPELVARLDPQKTIAYFARTQGWSAQDVMQQVLTPIDPSTITGTSQADELSIMCYQLPGSITKDGRPIEGGTDFTDLDRAFAAKVYPKPDQPKPPPVKPPQPPAPPAGNLTTIIVTGRVDEITIPGFKVIKE